MAGIGFLLRRLSKQNNIFGIVQAYCYSALAATGPWLFTVIALGSMMAINSRLQLETGTTFRSIIIYNFSFSLVLSAPFYMIATRYLADSIYIKDISTIPGALLGSLILLFAVQFPLVSAFYFLYADLSFGLAVCAIINYMLISSIWLMSVFITALKDYKTVSLAFLLGMTTATLSSGPLTRLFGTAGLLTALSIGLGIIITLLIARILVRYPFPLSKPFAFLPYFRKYWQIAAGGLIYNIAVWSDKWIMWFSPEATVLSNNIRIYPNYDSAMFLSYLTIIPSMALFLFNIETNFSEHYLRFYRDIENKVTIRKIKRNHQAILSSVASTSGSFLMLQGGISIMCILTAPKILTMLGNNYLQIGMFRYGVLGSLCHVLTIFLLILLSYFDIRKITLSIQLLFMTTNIAFTFASLHMGFEYYGYGYFLASLVTFIVALIATVRYMVHLPYHTFITTNSSIG